MPAASDATPSYDPVWLRCLEAARDALQEMADDGKLAGISSESIIVLEQPQVGRFFGPLADGSTGLDFPGIILWPGLPESSDPAGGSNERDEIAYRIAVSFVDKGSGATGTGAMVASRSAMRLHMLWRERVSRRFRLARWPEIDESLRSYAKPDAYAIPEAYRNEDLFHGFYVIEFTSWEGRDG